MRIGNLPAGSARPEPVEGCASVMLM